MIHTQPKKINQSKPFIVSRDEIPKITHVEKDEQIFNLGQLKDFRKVNAIKDFIPDYGRTSLSWVSLKSNDELKVHEHPICSMVIITSGHAELIGDMQQLITVGDVICIPPYTKHGFIGRGENGFWGLSVQFEKHGLYENPKKSLVHFDEQKSFQQKILHKQDEWKKAIAAHQLFEFVSLLKDKTSFLTVFKNWSDAFQELVLLRSVMVSNPKFQHITYEHLAEEFGHNRAFSHLNPVAPSLKMQAICSWFIQKMLKLDDIHRLVMMNLAIEGSATVFYRQLYGLFDKSKESAHFSEHNDLDHFHEGMGFNLINIASKNEFTEILTTLNDSWNMISELYTVLKEDCKKIM